MRAEKRSEPRWVSRTAVEVIHSEQLATFGGLAGLRDEGALEAALGRPRNKWSYGRERGFPALAAAYAYGITKNHPFADGNKRTAFLTMLAFLGLNGFDFEASEPDVVATMLELAAGNLTESRLTSWIQTHATPVRRRRSR